MPTKPNLLLLVVAASLTLAAYRPPHGLTTRNNRLGIPTDTSLTIAATYYPWQGDAVPDWTGLDSLRPAGTSYFASFPVSASGKLNASYSANLHLVRTGALLYVQAIDTGVGWLWLRNDAGDTILHARIRAVAPRYWAFINQSILARKYSQVLNYPFGMIRHSSWMLNKPMPAFEARTIDGQSIASNDLRGQPYFLTFWHYGCPSCMVAQPRLNALSAEFGDRIRFISCTHDSGYVDAGTKRFFPGSMTESTDGEPAHPVKDALSFRIDYTSCILTAPLDTALGKWGDPAFYLVDRNGRIRMAHMGYGDRMDSLWRTCMNAVLNDEVRIEE